MNNTLKDSKKQISNIIFNIIKKRIDFILFFNEFLFLLSFIIL